MSETTSEIFVGVKTIIKDKLSIENITRESNLNKDLGADSLDLVEIVMDIEGKYGIQLGDKTENLKTVGDLVDLIQSMVENKK